MATLTDLSSLGAAVSLLVALFVLYCVYYILRRSSSKLPPGPIGLPIVGNLVFLRKNPQEKLLDLRKKYGPVFSLRMGSNDMVALCDYSSIKSAMLQDAFAGASPNVEFEGKELYEKPEDFVKVWTEQKRFYVHLLKDLGFGKTEMEGNIKEEICCVLDIIEKQRGQPMSMSPILYTSVSNNIASLLFGRRMSYSDPKRILLDKLLKDYNKFFGQQAITAFFPWIDTLMRWFHLGNLKKLQEIENKLKEFFSNETEEHEKTLDPENIRDFIDGYLVQVEKKKNEPKPKFTKNMIAETAKVFFMAGADTVKFTVEWLLLANAAFTDVQQRIQKEIDEVIGKERFPTYKDHTKMPYTQAVIMEIMRWRNIFPLNFFRYSIKDAEVNSIFVPKSTYILLNTWGVTHDPALWGHPETFRPERFLTVDGNNVLKSEYLFPFSMGKRACPGESFANIEVFLYLTAILQKYDIHSPTGGGIDLEGELALSMQPKPQNLVFKFRE